MNNVALHVNGKIYSGWLSASISVGLTDVARSFALSVTQPASAARDSIKLGDSVQLYLDDDLLITGWVTESAVSYSASSVNRRISGSSKTIDLVECCLPNSAPKAYKDKTPSELLSSICSYFGIGFSDLAGKRDRITVNFGADGEIFGGLKKALNENNILLSDDENGRLVITVAGAGGYSYDALELGKNILSGAKNEKSAGLFSDYVVVGTPKNAGDAKSISEMRPAEKAVDSSVRSRTKVFIQTGDANAAKMRVRAALLRDVAKANSVSVDYTVQGWRQENGDLWKVNSSVIVRDGILFPGEQKEFLISKLVFSMDGSGQTTTLTCVPADAFAYTAEKTTAEAVTKATKGTKKTASAATLKYKTVGDLGQASWTKS